MHSFFLLTLLFPLAVITASLMLSARPRRGVVFGLSLPLDVANGPKVHAALSRYRLAVLVPGALTLVACGLAGFKGHAVAATLSYLAGAVAMIGVALMVRSTEAAKLRPQQVHVPVTRTAELATDASSAPLWWSAASVLPLIATALYVRGHWQNAPARWPSHWNAAGQVDGWATRPLGHMMVPLIFGTFLAAVFFVILAVQSFAPGPDMRRRQRLGAPLAAMAWAFSAFMSFEAIAPLLGRSAALGIWPVVVHVLVMFGIVIWICVRTGVISAFTGNKSGANTLPAHDGTPDECWHGGLFYYNPKDAALLVPKRFGFGWTFNMARPLAWVFLGGIILLVVGALFLPRVLK